MRGMYFQANYIEGLLDDRVRSTVPRWLAFFTDLVAAALLIYFSHKAKTLSGRFVLLCVFFVPIVLTYVAGVNMGYVLDFVLPLLLLFLHVLLEHYFDLRSRLKEVR
jgi:hypothetical protein